MLRKVSKVLLISGLGTLHRRVRRAAMIRFCQPVCMRSTSLAILTIIDNILAWFRAADEHIPGAGVSSGLGRYLTDPLIRPLSHVWQTPLRHDHLTEISQAIKDVRGKHLLCWCYQDSPERAPFRHARVWLEVVNKAGLES
jgi:hypothetical protein